MATRTSNDAKTLPGEYYTSPGIYDTETDRIFLRRWLHAGRCSGIEAPGSYFLFQVATESVIVLRDSEGELRAFHNVCRHRGTRLCTAAKGQFPRSIQCLYHAWTYALNGALIGAPNMDEVDSFRKEDYPLLPVAVAEWEGCIFLNLDPDPAPFGEAFGPMIDKFTDWRLSELEIAHSVTYDVAANWKLVFQNYSECYHCPALHPQLNRLTPYRNSSNDLEEGPLLGGPMLLAREGGSMTMSGSRCARPIAGLSGDQLNQIWYYTVFPSMLLSLHPDYVLIHRIQRLAADRTRIVCDWLFHPDAMAEQGFDPADAVEFWNVTNQQDWQVSELSQQGIASRAYRPGPYAALESMIAAWDREYLQALGG